MDIFSRLLNPRVLQILLALVVDQGVFTRGYSGLGLLDLRSKIFIAELHQKISGFDTLVIGNGN